MKINTTPGETYIVLSTGGCTATTGAGKQIKRLAAGQDFFTAMTGDTILSDDNASVAVAKGEMLSLLNTDTTGSGVQATLQFQPVTSQSALPATGENGVIYLVPNGADAPNQYTEWVWTGAAYEQLGDVGVDLSGYASKEDLGITSIAAGETGPLVTSDATLATKAVQVDSLKVGNGVSVAPHDVTITSVMVELTGGSSIKLSDSSSLSGDYGTLKGLTLSEMQALDITVMNTLRVGNGGLCYFESNGTGRLSGLGVSTLTVMAALKLGSSDYGFNSSGYGKLASLSVMDNLKVGGTLRVESGGNIRLSGSDGKSYILYGTGEGSLSKLTVMHSLQLGPNPVYYLDGDGDGWLHDLSVMGALCVRKELAAESNLRVGGYLEVGGNLTVGGDLSIIGTLRLGDDGTNNYSLHSNGNGNLGMLSVQNLIVGGASGLYGIDPMRGYLPGLTLVYGLSLGDSSNYYLGKNGGNLQGITLMDRLYFGGNSNSYLSGDGGKLRNLTIQEALAIGDTISFNPDGSCTLNNLTVINTLNFAASSSIKGDGWPDIVTNNIVPYLPAATSVEPEQPSFTTLTFPPTGTATEEQDPSWITKSHILMQTNGGQLNMTQLTATLAYAAQDPMSIANKTLWLSTSSGTGDAVQWPANAVFPDDQPQDKLQQLNSNSTYWFDITYVGGSDTVLIRKVCSWASTTGENGPTE